MASNIKEDISKTTIISKKVTLEDNSDNPELSKMSNSEIVHSLESLEDAIHSTNTSEEKTTEVKKLRLFDIVKPKDLLEIAIAEVESQGSSSESEELQEKIENEEEQEENKRNFLIIEEPHKFLEFDIYSDAEISTEDEPSKVEMEYEFFDVFEDIPQVDDISGDLTDDLLWKKSTDIEDEHINATDTGKFVNPLTGVLSLSSTLSKTSKAIEDHQSLEESASEQKVEEEKQSEEYESDKSKEEVFNKDIEKSIDDFEVIGESVKDIDDTLQQFLEMEKESSQVDLKPDKGILIAEEQKRLVQYQTLEFLNNLIDHCVTKAEYIDNNIILRKNLSKIKLIQELKLKYDLFESERRGLHFLNRKCVEYFKRKSSLRLITFNDPKTINRDKKEFHNALETLDKWLIKEKTTKDLYSTQVLNLEEQFQDIKLKTDEEINKLKQLIRTTFQHDTFTRLQTSVNSSLNKMSAIRKEIANVRFRLLLKLHQITSLREQMKKIQDLGNGLKLSHYEALETQANTLGQKIDERNSALNALRNRCNSDLHSLSHLKEKQKMLRHTLNVQKQYLEELHTEKKRLRALVSSLERKRKQIRIQIRNVSFQSGLLDKPALMKDYDETVATANNITQTIENLKGTVEQLMNKIAIFENLNCKVNL